MGTAFLTAGPSASMESPASECMRAVGPKVTTRYGVEQAADPCFHYGVSQHEDEFSLDELRARMHRDEQKSYPRKCLSCNHAFRAQGRYNRICAQCKNKNRSTLPEFELASGSGFDVK